MKRFVNWFSRFSFSLPALVIFAIFFITPALFSLYYSFFRWNGLDPQMRFVGLANFVELFRDERFWNSLSLTIQTVVVSILLQISLAFLLASLCVAKRRGMKILRSALFLPQVMSVAAVGAAWVLIYDPYYGILNKLIEALGFGRVRVSWLGSSTIALPAMITTTIWAYFGFHMILFMAAISSIPVEIYDAAKLETASSLKTFFFVTLPLLRETVLVSCVFIITGTFGFLVGLFWVMTRGGPSQATDLLGLYMYRTTFVGNRFGYASAIAVVMILIMVAVVWIPVRRMARERIEF